MKPNFDELIVLKFFGYYIRLREERLLMKWKWNKPKCQQRKKADRPVLHSFV